MTRAGWTKKILATERRYRRLSQILITVAIFLSIALFIWFMIGKETGQECFDNWDCFGFGSFCQSTQNAPYRYCSKTCEEISDCPEQWVCRKAPFYDKSRAALEIKTVCVPPPL